MERFEVNARGELVAAGRIGFADAAAHACALKIPAGQDSFDDSWTVKFADVNEGHEGANLVYAGAGKALFRCSAKIATRALNLR